MEVVIRPFLDLHLESADNNSKSSRLHAIKKAQNIELTSAAATTGATRPLGQS
jgi:hypothetical protein